MKKIIILLFIIIFAFFMVNAQQDVVIKDAQTFCYAFMDFQGSFELIPQKISIFMKEFFKQSLTSSGPLLGVYYNSPEEVKEEDLKWGIGFPVSKDSKVQEPLKMGEFKYKKIAEYLYVGPYEKSEGAYNKIFKHINDKGYKVIGPFFESYLNDPSQVKPEELKTNIFVPVKETIKD